LSVVSLFVNCNRSAPLAYRQLAVKHTLQWHQSELSLPRSRPSCVWEKLSSKSELSGRLP